MLSSSDVAKQTDKVLEGVLEKIREDYERPFPVLCETDRSRFVEEEQSLRERLKETKGSQLNGSGWRNLLCFPSPQASKCLTDAEELLQRVREDINSKVRTRLAGKSNLPRPSSAIMSSPLNMRCSLSEPGVSEMNANINPSAQNETSSESSDGSCNSSNRPHRRPPPPPPSQLMVLPNSSHPSAESLSDSSSGSTRRPSSIRRPAPPPPRSPMQSRTPRSPSNAPLPSPPPRSSPLDPAMIASISRLTQQMNTLASSIVTDGVSRQARGRQRSRRSDIRSNCLNIEGSDVDGVTMNLDSTNCSGAVIHKTTVPSSRLPQHV